MSDTVLNVQSLTAGYVPGLPILHDVNMRLGRGEIVAVIGPNGAGKSTLIKAIAGLVHVEEGTIMLANETWLGSGLMRWRFLGLLMSHKQTIFLEP